MELLRAALAIAFFCVAAWVFSSDRRRFPWRVVGFGVVLQFVLAALILGTSGGRSFFEAIGDFVAEMLVRSAPGAEMVFGDLAKADGPAGFIFAFASSGLIVIIVFSALMAVLYHIGFMQLVIYVLARIMTTTMGVSGAEAMAMGANIFVGQTEAPLVVRPYLLHMTRSELTSLMTGGFANIAGSVLAVYMGILGPEIGPHLLTASVMSAPAAFVLAKILVPETEATETGADVKLRVDRDASNVIEAAANGTTDGLKLWLNVIAMLIAFVALVRLIDWPLGAFASWIELEGGLSLARIFGWTFAPIAWLMGIEGWHDSQIMGSLLGTKITINEFVAYTEMVNYLPSAPLAEAGQAFQHSRSVSMATYALCGFANFSSIGIQIGGISALVPERKTELSRLALRSMLGGAAASCMTASIAGVFLA